MSATEQDFQEQVTFSPFPPVAELLVTADGHACGFLPEPSGHMRFVFDGVAGEPFDEVVPMYDGTTTFWSADDEHVAYIGLRSGGSFVGRNEGEDPAFEAPTRSVPPTFSADGAHLAYGAQVDGVYKLVLDGEVVSEQPLAPIAVGFSPDGSRLAYVEQSSATDAKAQHRIVLDGVAGPWFRGMRNASGVLQFSPDSRRFAYYRINEKVEGQWVVDGVEHRWVNDVPWRLGSSDAAQFSPDSRRFAYWADVKEKGVAVLEGDIPGPLLHSAGWPVFSPDSRHLVYAGQTFTKKAVVVVDGVAGPEWLADDVGDPVVSPDSRRVAITLRRNEGGFLRKRRICAVVLDGQLLAEQPGDDMSPGAVFSPDSSRVAWLLKRGSDWFVFVDDQAGARLDGAGGPVFSSSGHVVHGAEVGQSSTIMVDGRPGPLAQSRLTLSADPADPHCRLSPDGEHVAWIGQFADGVRPVMDDRIGPVYEHIASCSFLGDGSAEWWGQRGTAVYRVTVRA